MLDGYEYIQKAMPNQPAESDEGNREYKWKLVDRKKIRKIASQLQYRLYEGDGRALYMIGVTDKGNSWGIDIETLAESLQYLEDACNELNKENPGHKITKARIYPGLTQDKYVATVRVARPPKSIIAVPPEDTALAIKI